MHAEKLCHRWLRNDLPEIHAKRLLALSAIVSGALRGGCLSVTGVGRWLRGKARTKHNIKRADRLFSNTHLQSELPEIYRSLSEQILGSENRPVILIDWSDIDARRKFFLLRASVAVKGRSLTLYEEVHSKAGKEKRRTHSKFLKNLRAVLPEGCTPILVTDAGFRTPWFKQVLAMGWDFVGRVRNVEMVQLAPNSPWRGEKALYPRATNVAKLFANIVLTRSNQLTCSLVLFKEKPKGRKRLTKIGKKARNNMSLANSRRAEEPWLLATSLSVQTDEAKSIVNIYATRMQIEESFRDLKCPRYGIGLYNNRTYKIERLRILLLVGTIANTFAWLMGKIARARKIHMQFQANTTSFTDVLSNVFIGLQIFRQSNLKIPWHCFKNINKEISLAHYNLYFRT